MRPLQLLAMHAGALLPTFRALTIWLAHENLSTYSSGLASRVICNCDPFYKDVFFSGVRLVLTQSTAPWSRCNW